MSRDVWKISKFHGGINSYTDPKDISSNEFVELTDVDVSKIGIARMMGGITTGAEVHKVTTGGIIPGKGLYRYINDNSFVSQLDAVNGYSYDLFQHETGGGGSPTYADIGFQSVAWVFHTDVTIGGSFNSELPEGHRYPTKIQDMQFTLKVNNVAITNAFTVFDSASSGETFPYRPHQEYGMTSTYGVDITEDQFDTNEFKSMDWAIAYTTWGDDNYSAYDITESFEQLTSLYGSTNEDTLEPYPFQNDSFASGTNVPHKVVQRLTQFGHLEDDIITDDPFVINGDFQNGPNDPKASRFWSCDVILNPTTGQVWNNTSSCPWGINLNKRRLIFDATYANNGIPNGDLDWHEHSMMGFYGWRGYELGIQDSTGTTYHELSSQFSFNGYDWIGNPMYSAFYTPAPKYFGGDGSNAGETFETDPSGNWNQELMYDSHATELGSFGVHGGAYVNYWKAKMGFMHKLIEEINSYGGTGDHDRFNARWSLFDTHDGIVSYNQSGGHRTNVFVGNGIHIQSRAPSGNLGAIKGALTCGTVSGAGSASYVNSSNVKLLSSEDTMGCQTNDPGLSNNPPPAIVDDHQYSGTGIVQSGNITTYGGSAPNVYEEWRLIIRGNSVSGDRIEIFVDGVEDPDSEWANIPPYTNIGEAVFDQANLELVANNCVSDINSNTASTNITSSAFDPSVEYPDEYGIDEGLIPTAWGIKLIASVAGQTYQFVPSLIWYANVHTDSIIDQVTDEQVAYITRSNRSISEQSPYADLNPDSTLKLTNLHLFSTYTSSWLYQFKHIENTVHNTFIDEKYQNCLNWYYTNNFDNDPLFWDEGSILRIIETNFKLTEEVKLNLAVINNGVPTEDTNYIDGGNQMEANPSQWIGYKELSNHFSNAYNQGDLGAFDDSDAKRSGWFMGKLDKKWIYSTNEAQINSGGFNKWGLIQETDTWPAYSGNSDGIPGDSPCMKVVLAVNAAGGSDWHGTIQVYAVACYDDGSESLPGHAFTGAAMNTDAFGDAGDVKSLDVGVIFRPFDENGIRTFSDVRINGIRLYYTHDDDGYENFWNLGKIDFERGWISAKEVSSTEGDSGNLKNFDWYTLEQINTESATWMNNLESMINEPYLDSDAYNNAILALGNKEDVDVTINIPSMPKTETYEDINGISPYTTVLSMRYKAACIAGRRLFVGNLRVWDGERYRYYNDRMVVSPAGMLDTLPYPTNILDLDISDGDEIVALAAVGDRVFQFKKRVCYILNISTGIASEFFIEERLRWKGIENKNHFCNTDVGLFWFNENGAWIHDGEQILDLFVRPDKKDNLQRRIGIDKWKSFVSESSLCGYNPETREIFIIKKSKHTNSNDGDCYVYSMITESWTKGSKKFFVNTGINPPVDSPSSSITNIINVGSTGDVSFMAEYDSGEVHNPQGSEQ